MILFLPRSLNKIAGHARRCDFSFAPENARHLRMYAHHFRCARQNFCSRCAERRNIRYELEKETKEATKSLTSLHRRSGLSDPAPVVAAFSGVVGEIQRNCLTIMPRQALVALFAPESFAAAGFAGAWRVTHHGNSPRTSVASATLLTATVMAAARGGT